MRIQLGDNLGCDNVYARALEQFESMFPYQQTVFFRKQELSNDGTLT